MNKGTGKGKFGGSEGRKKEGLEEEDVQTVLPVLQLIQKAFVQISEIFGLVKQYIRMGSYPFLFHPK